MKREIKDNDTSAAGTGGVAHTESGKTVGARVGANKDGDLENYNP